ncbi:MAG: hypothetical protein U5K56_17140 [Halioglobus sp.]|nr:hypothetical protein [Halioglobus sp.]
MGKGLYATPVPLQIFAYSSAQLRALHESRLRRGGDSLLGGRILELIRIRSAQLGECQPCMQSRKHDSITDDDVACLLDMQRAGSDGTGADGGQVLSTCCTPTTTPSTRARNSACAGWWR